MTALIGTDALWEELGAIRRDIHAHPELAYAERRTAALVANQLESIGLEVETGIAGTGVVATLQGGPGPSIGLRADMDALPILEANGFAHRSRVDGKMHACGHDGHTAMLLGAARHLAAQGGLAGTVRFIFQPAEEAAGGARVMLDEGLFERFPVDAVFGMHNWPGLPVGHFAMRPGPMMASLDCFDAVIEGKGTHGALPQHGIDPIATAALAINAVQSIVSRNVDPLRSAVISVTRIHGGDAYNIVPERVELGGGIRSFEPAVRALLKQRLEAVIAGVAGAMGARSSMSFSIDYPAVINDPVCTALAESVAAGLAGEDAVDGNADPVLGSEDFAFMLERKRGCYVLIGNGDSEGSCMIHNPGYDFNDEVIPIGVNYWVSLAEAFVANPLA